MTYVNRITAIRKINKMLKKNDLNYNAQIIGEVIEEFSGLSDVDKMCVFEYLVFRYVK
jgi:hypothetical protein